MVLVNCFAKKQNTVFCNEDFKKEIVSTLNRRIILPFYIPLIALICALSLIKTNKIYLNKYLVFLYSFVLLVFTELSIKYTGINNLIFYFFMILPFILFFLLYFFLTFKFSRELKI